MSDQHTAGPDPLRPTDPAQPTGPGTPDGPHGVPVADAPGGVAPASGRRKPGTGRILVIALIVVLACAGLCGIGQFITNMLNADDWADLGQPVAPSTVPASPKPTWQPPNEFVDPQPVLQIRHQLESWVLTSAGVARPMRSSCERRDFTGEQATTFRCTVRYDGQDVVYTISARPSGSSTFTWDAEADQTVVTREGLHALLYSRFGANTGEWENLRCEEFPEVALVPAGEPLSQVCYEGQDQERPDHHHPPGTGRPDARDRVPGGGSALSRTTGRMSLLVVCPDSPAVRFRASVPGKEGPLAGAGERRVEGWMPTEANGGFWGRSGPTGWATRWVFGTALGQVVFTGTTRLVMAVLMGAAVGGLAVWLVLRRRSTRSGYADTAPTGPAGQRERGRPGPAPNPAHHRGHPSYPGADRGRPRFSPRAQPSAPRTPSAGSRPVPTPGPVPTRPAEGAPPRVGGTRASDARPTARRPDGHSTVEPGGRFTTATR